MLDVSQRILSEITIFNKYAKYDEKLKRRETWDEICERYLDMLVERYPLMKEEILINIEFVKQRKVLPSMRALQFAGSPIKKNEARTYNCCFLHIDSHLAFSETMFLLLGGTGVGYSVQYQHISKLPLINIPNKEKKFLIGDSIEGWADAVKALMKAYFGFSKTKPRFDFSDIRPKGARLITAGGKAPGPEPLKECLFQVEKILQRKVNGEKLTPLECHDILCYIANAVLAGGIRRAAMIALFSLDDMEMMTCKTEAWYELNEQRGRANNSVVLHREETTKEQFDNIWKLVELSGAGEPGVSWTNNKEWGFNPCHEIALQHAQFCNLTEVNVSNITSQEDLNERVKVAAFFGTLQSGFTDFHYLRPIWREVTEKEALIGVGMTGIASGEILKYDLTYAAGCVKDENSRVSSSIGTNPAARCTTIKPSGTTSLVLGTSSGIHAWHSPYYVRRMRLGKDETLYKYLAQNHPELIEDDVFKPHIQAIVSIPQQAPSNAILRTETALELLERVALFSKEWVRSGHRTGDNTHNVSATISIYKSESIDEWSDVVDWMWLNKDNYSGLSVLPVNGGSYTQAPFEEITEEKYLQMISSLKTIDLTQIIEEEDMTDQAQEPACSGGACEIV